MSTAATSRSNSQAQNRPRQTIDSTHKESRQSPTKPPGLRSPTFFHLRHNDVFAIVTMFAPITCCDHHTTTSPSRCFSSVSGNGRTSLTPASPALRPDRLVIMQLCHHLRQSITSQNRLHFGGKMPSTSTTKLSKIILASFKRPPVGNRPESPWQYPIRLAKPTPNDYQFSLFNCLFRNRKSNEPTSGCQRPLAAFCFGTHPATVSSCRETAPSPVAVATSTPCEPNEQDSSGESVDFTM